MRSTFNVLFYLKRDKQKRNGLTPIHCRITFNGKVTQFNTKAEINPQNWDVKAYKAIGRTTEINSINQRNQV